MKNLLLSTSAVLLSICGVNAQCTGGGHHPHLPNVNTSVRSANSAGYSSSAFSISAGNLSVLNRFQMDAIKGGGLLKIKIHA